MRIAVASHGLDVSKSFGSCTNFNYYLVQGNELADSRNLPSQGHPLASQVDFLKALDAQVLLCGAIPQKDLDAMHDAGITVVTGLSGRAIECARAYLASHASLA